LMPERNKTSKNVGLFRGQFHQHFMRSFYKRGSQKCKKIQSSNQSFLRFWDLGV
jgi:hypothetical protein